MYIYTIVVAGGCGLGMILAPNFVKFIFRLPQQDPIAFSILGSVYLAFGLLSILGLRAPLKFVPVLLLQLCYKAIWFVGFVIPLCVKWQFPFYAAATVIIFATFVIGDIIAIPFSYIFLRKE
jgi:hypothetical protein